MEPDRFTTAYIECALWSSTDDNGEPMDGLYTVDDIDPDTLARMVEDCADFQAEDQVREILGSEECEADDEQAGHDFWMTRNGHGAGFWDRGGLYGSEKAGRILTDCAKAWGSFDLYIGDDGNIHRQ